MRTFRAKANTTRRVAGQMNKTEQAYAALLQCRKDAGEIQVEMCMRSGYGLPGVTMTVVDHDAKFTSALFRALVKSIGSESCLTVGLAYHKNTNAKVERQWH